MNNVDIMAQQVADAQEIKRLREENVVLKAESEEIKNTWNDTAKVIAAKALDIQAEYGVELHEALSDAVYGSSVNLALEVKALKAKLEAARGLIEAYEHLGTGVDKDCMCIDGVHNRKPCPDRLPDSRKNWCTRCLAKAAHQTYREVIKEDTDGPS